MALMQKLPPLPPPPPRARARPRADNIRQYLSQPASRI
jgi:hypothetical protein